MDPFDVVTLDKDKDVATNVLIITCFIVVFLMAFLIFYPLLCRRPLKAWWAKRKQNQKVGKDVADDKSKALSEIQASLI